MGTCKTTVGSQLYCKADCESMCCRCLHITGFFVLSMHSPLPIVAKLLIENYKVLYFMQLI